MRSSLSLYVAVAMSAASFGFAPTTSFAQALSPGLAVECICQDGSAINGYETHAPVGWLNWCTTKRGQKVYLIAGSCSRITACNSGAVTGLVWITLNGCSNTTGLIYEFQVWGLRQ